MDLNLKGKVAFITGAGMGIAKGIALAFADEGVDISFMEFNKNLLEQSSKDIKAKGVKVQAILGSTTEVADVKEAVRNTIDTFGRIDILVNSAGSSPGGDVLPISHEDWAHAFDVKFLGYVRCIKEVVPHMINQGGGKVINLIGVGATEIVPLHVAGASNNAAAVILTSYLAQEVGKHNILVIGINPGMVGPTAKLTRQFEAIAKDQSCTVQEIEQETVKRSPLGRFCQVEDIANLAVFLASDANKFITGEIITIDGGHTKAIMNG
jgi:NAD(P)-dependent dehydrogenase (short-subunit alcohol dehydrogenase family)